MPYKIDRFNFDDQTVKNFNRVGITPDQIKGWIDDGRANGIKDERIADFIKDRYTEMNEPYMRGRNTGGALRYAASNLPWIGDSVDEIEAVVRSGKISGPEYDKYVQNARESIAGAAQAFKERRPDDNWVERNVLHYAPETIRVAGDTIAAVGSGGLTLMPGVSSIQGALEGYGAGVDPANRRVRALGGAALGFAVPAVLNKVFPTKSVTERTIKGMAKGTLLGAKKPAGNVIAKAIQAGEEPVSIIAKESTRATEPAIMKGLQQALKGNDAQAKVIYDSAVRNVDYEGGFIKYIKDRMPKGLSEKVSNRLSKGFAALENGFEEYGANNADLLVKENLPEMIDTVINTSMRGASEAERNAVKNAAIKAFSERHTAKEVTKKLIPQSMIGNLGNQVSMIRPDRVLTRPVSNVINAGTLNTLRGGVPIANPYVDRLLKALQRDSVRGATDSIIENTLK